LYDSTIIRGMTIFRETPSGCK